MVNCTSADTRLVFSSKLNIFHPSRNTPVILLTSCLLGKCGWSLTCRSHKVVWGNGRQGQCLAPPQPVLVRQHVPLMSLLPHSCHEPGHCASTWGQQPPSDQATLLHLTLATGNTKGLNHNHFHHTLLYRENIICQTNKSLRLIHLTWVHNSLQVAGGAWSCTCTGTHQTGGQGDTPLATWTNCHPTCVCRRKNGHEI